MPVLFQSPWNASPQPGMVPPSGVLLSTESWTMSVGRKQPSTIPLVRMAEASRAGLSFTTFSASVILSLPLLRPFGATTSASRPGRTFCLSAIVLEKTTAG